jgi:peptide/nickel transport system substrate-binding protein
VSGVGEGDSYGEAAAAGQESSFRRLFQDTMSRTRSFQLAAASLALAAAFGAAQAASFRWASANDLLTFDPHAQNHQTTLAFLQQVYEGLTRYDDKYQVQPGLATKWTLMSPTQLRFELRRNVKFHDGTPFTADDVVFSLTRAMTPPSNMTAYVQSIKEVKS